MYSGMIMEWQSCTVEANVTNNSLVEAKRVTTCCSDVYDFLAIYDSNIATGGGFEEGER